MSGRTLSEQVVLRLDPGLRAELAKWADEDRRPMASLIRIVLEDWVEGRSQSAPREHAA
jgi:hypothetical protein